VCGCWGCCHGPTATLAATAAAAHGGLIAFRSEEAKALIKQFDIPGMFICSRIFWWIEQSDVLNTCPSHNESQSIYQCTLIDTCSKNRWSKADLRITIKPSKTLNPTRMYAQSPSAMTLSSISIANKPLNSKLLYSRMWVRVSGWRSENKRQRMQSANRSIYISKYQLLNS
jgi:hypothetical protein